MQQRVREGKRNENSAGRRLVAGYYDPSWHLGGTNSVWRQRFECGKRKKKPYLELVLSFSPVVTFSIE